MAEETAITADNFTLLLRWLDPDVEVAGRKYEAIRRRLIVLFTARGCYDPEMLSDHTIDRVTRKVSELDAAFDGEPIGYFYKVAGFIHKEWLRSERSKGYELPVTDLIQDSGSSSAMDTSESEEFRCLESCLTQLPSKDHYMIVEYYRYPSFAKSRHRQSLADKLQISIGNLHTRTNRVREKLLRCIRDCTAAL